VRIVLPVVALSLGLVALGADIEQPSRARRVVSHAEILAAMRESRGYDLTATANGARLQAEVVFRLVRAARAQDPDGAPLFLSYRDWYVACLDRVQLTHEQAPLYARLAYENRQDSLLDYRTDHVVARVVKGPEPLVAVNVTTGWTAGRSRYSYEDELASPRLRVVCERLLRYRLLDFGDFYLFDQVEGLRGRPTSGVLGALFDVIGEVAVVQSRMAVAADGTLVTRGVGRKAFLSIAATATVTPEGKGDKGVPPDRPDLAALEERLSQPLELVYVPWPQ